MSLAPRLLGTTGLTVTPLGLGLAALGRPGYINLGHAVDLDRDYDVAAMEARAHAVLDTAWNAGVRYFDAARSYGRAEEFLGRWLAARRIPPGAVTIASKWGYVYTAGWQVEARRARRGCLTAPSSIPEGDLIGVRLSRDALGQPPRPGRCLLHTGDGKLITVSVPAA